MIYMNIKKILILIILSTIIFATEVLSKENKILLKVNNEISPQ